MTPREIRQVFRLIGGLLWSSLRDLLPIIMVVGLFQVVVFQQPLDNFLQILLGILCVVLGLTLFVQGLNLGLFPLGEGMAHDFARKGSLPWLVVFAFSLGFGTTFAEPALIAVAEKAAELRSSSLPAETAPELVDNARARFAILLRGTVSVSVGCALVLGVLRIIYGWSLPYLIIAGYLIVMVLTPFTPAQMVAVAYDAGGVTTSTITVPLTTALGVGLASSIQGRNPLLDGFGLIALASVMPIIFVLLLGIALG